MSGMNSVSSALTSLYNDVGNQLSTVMQKIAAGTNWVQPSDDYVGYLQTTTLQNSNATYTQTNADIAQGKVVTDAGQAAGNQVYTDAVALQNLAANYATAAPADQAAIGTQFTSLATQIAGEVTSANVGGTLLFGGTLPNGTGVGGAINLGGGQTLDFTTNGVNTAASAIGTDAVAAVGVTTGVGVNQPSAAALAAATTLVNDVQTYLSGMQAGGKILDNQTALNNTIIASQNSAITSISKIDDAAALAQETDLQVREQAGISMLSQANISRQGMVKLFQ